MMINGAHLAFGDYLARQHARELYARAEQDRLIAEDRRNRGADSTALTTPVAVAAPPAPDRGRRARSHGAGSVGLILDVGLPLVAYYVLHATGVSDRAALLAATVAAGGRLAWVAYRTRRLTWFSMIMLGVFGVGFALAFVGGDPRILLLKDSAGTATIGATFLISLLGEHPLTFSAAQTWKPHEADRLAELYRREPAVRRAFRVSASGWGVGLLVESLVRIPLVSLLPIDWAVGLSTALMITAMAALLCWNVGYMMHAAHRAPALRVLLPGTLWPDPDPAAGPGSSQP